MSENESIESILSSWLKDWSERIRYPIISTMVGVICISNLPEIIDLTVGDRRQAFLELKKDILSSNIVLYLLVSFMWIFVAPWINYWIENLRHKLTLNRVKAGYKKLAESLNVAIKTAIPDNQYSIKIREQECEINDLKGNNIELQKVIESYKQIRNGNDYSIYSGVLNKMFRINSFGDELRNYSDLIKIKTVLDKLTDGGRSLTRTEIEHIFSICREAIGRIKFNMPSDYDGINISDVLVENKFNYRADEDLQAYLFDSVDISTAKTILNVVHNVLAVNIFDINLRVFINKN